jgi:hypothetical protein
LGIWLFSNKLQVLASLIATDLVHLSDVLVALEVDLHQVGVLVEAEGLKSPDNILAIDRLALLLLAPLAGPITPSSITSYNTHNTRW